MSLEDLLGTPPSVSTTSGLDGLLSIPPSRHNTQNSGKNLSGIKDPEWHGDKQQYEFEKRYNYYVAQGLGAEESSKKAWEDFTGPMTPERHAAEQYQQLTAPRATDQAPQPLNYAEQFGMQPVGQTVHEAMGFMRKAGSALSGAVLGGPAGAYAGWKTGEEVQKVVDAHPNVERLANDVVAAIMAAPSGPAGMVGAVGINEAMYSDAFNKALEWSANQAGKLSGESNGGFYNDLVQQGVQLIAPLVAGHVAGGVVDRFNAKPKLSITESKQPANVREALGKTLDTMTSAETSRANMLEQQNFGKVIDAQRKVPTVPGAPEPAKREFLFGAKLSEPQEATRPVGGPMPELRAGVLGSETGSVPSDEPGIPQMAGTLYSGKEYVPPAAKPINDFIQAHSDFLEKMGVPRETIDVFGPRGYAWLTRSGFDPSKFADTREAAMAMLHEGSHAAGSMFTDIVKKVQNLFHATAYEDLPKPLRTVSDFAKQVIQPRYESTINKALQIDGQSVGPQDFLQDTHGRKYNATYGELYNKYGSEYGYNEKTRWAVEHTLFNRNPEVIAQLKTNKPLWRALSQEANKMWESGASKLVKEIYGEEGMKQAARAYLERKTELKAEGWLPFNAEELDAREMTNQAVAERILSGQSVKPGGMVHNPEMEKLYREYGQPPEPPKPPTANGGGASGEPPVPPNKGIELFGKSENGGDPRIKYLLDWQKTIFGAFVKASSNPEFANDAVHNPGPWSLSPRLNTFFDPQFWKALVGKAPSPEALKIAWNKWTEAHDILKSYSQLPQRLADIKKTTVNPLKAIPLAAVEIAKPFTSYMRKMGQLATDLTVPYFMRDWFFKPKNVEAIERLKILNNVKQVIANNVATMANMAMESVPTEFREFLFDALKRQDVYDHFQANKRLPIDEIGFEDLTKKFKKVINVEELKGNLEVHEGVTHLSEAYGLLAGMRDSIDGFYRMHGMIDPTHQWGEGKMWMPHFNKEQELARLSKGGYGEDWLIATTGGDKNTIREVNLRSLHELPQEGGKVIKDPVYALSRMYEDLAKDWINKIAGDTIKADGRLTATDAQFKKNPEKYRGWKSIRETSGPLADVAYVHPDVYKAVVPFFQRSGIFKNNAFIILRNMLSWIPRVTKTVLSPNGHLQNWTFGFTMWAGETGRSVFDPTTWNDFRKHFNRYNKEYAALRTTSPELVDRSLGSLGDAEHMGVTTFHLGHDPLFQGLGDVRREQLMQLEGKHDNKNIFSRVYENAQDLYVKPDKVAAAAIYHDLVTRGVDKVEAMQRARAAIVDTANAGDLWHAMTQSGMALFAPWRMEAIPSIARQMTRNPLAAANGVAMAYALSLIVSKAMGYSPVYKNQDSYRDFLPFKLQNADNRLVGVKGDKGLFTNTDYLADPYTLVTGFVKNGWPGFKNVMNSIYHIKDTGVSEMIDGIITGKDSYGNDIYDPMLLKIPAGQSVANKIVAKWASDKYFGYFATVAKAVPKLASSQYKDQFGNGYNLAQFMNDVTLGLKIYEMDMEKTKRGNIKSLQAENEAAKQIIYKLDNDNYWKGRAGINDPKQIEEMKQQYQELIQKNYSEISRLYALEAPNAKPK